MEKTPIHSLRSVVERYDLLFSTPCGQFGYQSTIWYHLHNLKNVKNTHGGVLLLINLHLV